MQRNGGGGELEIIQIQKTQISPPPQLPNVGILVVKAFNKTDMEPLV